MRRSLFLGSQHDAGRPLLRSGASCRYRPIADKRRRRVPAIDRNLPHAPELQQTSCTSLLLSIDGTDRQTDGRTPDRYMPLTVILIIISFPSPTLFHSRLKTVLFCKSFPLQPFFFFFRTDYMIPQTFTVTSEYIRFYFLVFFLFCTF